ncbi:FAD-binding domain-containing protein, partial [Psychroserpens sp.]|uniref:cryptochrome/deoxyribodipyrimidine photo-lyase family protein n=1 Tax=Psychroserpens sp. TaxID=2020870 RepID=UPI003C7308D0
CFVKESLSDLNKQLKIFNTKILLVQAEVKDTFIKLLSHFPISNIYSTQEIGIDLTFQRDIEMSLWFEENNIQWVETQYNGVIRGLKSRKGWSYAWKKYMTAPQVFPNFDEASLWAIDEVKGLEENFNSINLNVPRHNFQIGGRTEAVRWADSFFQKRIFHYSEGISKPQLSRKTCSRLSPYFAWGNMSIREIYQRAISLKPDVEDKRPINAFLARLRWQSHFIQKFEMEPRMEFEAINKAYLELEQPTNEAHIVAWKSGQTGYPLVDASIRALIETGYINFRMRSMCVSFFTHHLFQHFSLMGEWLAQQFLDFEPGIHYGQLQMQSGFTGTNTVRIYNPTKNAHDHDSDAIFIKNWVKELENLPPNLAIEPWLMTAMEEKLYKFKLGNDYPERIVDISETRKPALDKLYGMRKSDLFKKEKQRILDKHTIKRNYN